MKLTKYEYSIIECDFCLESAIKLHSHQIGKIVTRAESMGWKILGTRDISVLKRKVACPSCVKERAL